ncbi:glycosyl transferase [Chromatium weissei]|nr:glycosyl transferase [Chromatium weissei]
MKILHVEAGRHLYGGALQVLYLLRGLAAHGHHNLLVCPRGSALAAAAAPFAEVHPLTLHGDVDVLMIGKLWRLIRATQPELVHLHSRRGADVFGGMAARLAGVPVIHTRRVDNAEPRWRVALKYRLHDRVIAISAGIANVLIDEGLSPKKLRMVRSAVDWQRYAPAVDRTVIRARLKVPTDALLVGVIAQLIPRKGHRFLLAALPELLAAHSNLQVRFFGQGALAKELQRQIDAAELNQCVQLAGFRDDLAEILPALDLVVHPVLMEGLGVSLLQAASAGVPIVASRVGGIPEAVRDGENGILVPPGEVDALREAILALLANSALRQQFGVNGQALMAREFSIDAMVEGNLAVYRELIT